MISAELCEEHRQLQDLVAGSSTWFQPLGLLMARLAHWAPSWRRSPGRTDSSRSPLGLDQELNKLAGWQGGKVGNPDDYAIWRRQDLIERQQKEAA